MELRILVFGLFLLGGYEAASFGDDIIGISRRTTVPVNDVNKLVIYSLRADPRESIVVTFNSTSLATLWHISNKSDYDYASKDNPGVMSMAGILLALRHSPPDSPLWVFTDKPVKDPVKYHEVVYTSQMKGNPIFFAIFGPRNHSFSMHHDVATATNGQVFYLQKNETRELISYVEHLRRRQKDVVFTKTFSPDVENNEFSVVVDINMIEVIIAVTGEAEEPVVTVTDPSGLGVGLTGVTRISAITVLKLPVNPGVYKVQVSSPRETRVDVTAFTSITFRHGFSARTPSDFNETSRIPVPGTGHLSILLDNEEGLELRSVLILDMDYTLLMEAPVQSVFVVDESATPRFYTTDPITIPDHTFQIAIYIHHASSGTNLTRHGSTPITPSLAYKCQQPKKEGPCRGVFHKWYYDNAINECRQFVYGGCAGNENRFPSQAECDRECGPAPPAPDPPAPEIGGENGIQPNPASKTNICPENEFACSKNPVPACISNAWVCDGDLDCPLGEDEDIDECRNSQCGPNMFRCPSGKCLLQSWVCDGQNDCSDMEASDEQNCTTSHHSPPPRPENADVPSNGICLSWMFTCGNNNCIPHWWRCDGMNDCGDNSDEVGCGNAKCQQPMDAGPCRSRGEFPRWYYDNSLKICRRFAYGGCRGNENRFPSQAECDRECGPAPPAPDPPAPEIGGENGIQPNPASKTNICPENRFACSTNTTVPICMPNAWVCDGDLDCPLGEDEDIDKCRNYPCLSTSFKCPKGKCISQSWVCNGYNDCSDLEASDEQNCTTSHHSPSNDKCQQPLDPGPCWPEVPIPMWYYDGTIKTCQLFAHSGCGGNDNRFDSEEECLRECPPPPAPPVPQMPVIDKCQQPKDRGSCGGMFIKWYYHYSLKMCLVFTYSGCGGNANKFDSWENCHSQCYLPISELISNTTEHQHHKLASTDKTLDVQKNITCRQRDDELETFGRYVASTLRKLNEKVAINAQDEIQRILSKFKLRNLKRTSS